MRLRLLYAADIHASNRHLGRLLALAGQEHVDAVIVGGDIVPHHLAFNGPSDPVASQKKYLQKVLLPRLSAFEQQGGRIYLDLGNDDFWANRTLLAEAAGERLHLLHMCRHRLAEDLDIIGYMTVPPTPFTRKEAEKADTAGQPFAPGNRVTLTGWQSRKDRLVPKTLDLAAGQTIEAELRQLDALVRTPFVFVSHSPPYQTPLDVIDGGQHVGSLAIRRFIERWQAKGMLKVSLHGHIHESPMRSGAIATNIGSAICINPGQHAGSDVPLRGVWLELDPAGGEIRHQLFSYS